MGASPMRPTGILPVEESKTHGRDGHATRGRDARDTHAAGCRVYTHGQDAHATIKGHFVSEGVLRTKP